MLDHDYRNDVVGRLTGDMDCQRIRRLFDLQRSLVGIRKQIRSLDAQFSGGYLKSAVLRPLKYVRIELSIFLGVSAP